MQLESGCLVWWKSPTGNPTVGGHVYVDVDGVRHSVEVQATIVLGKVELTVGPLFELVLTLACEDFKNKIANGDFKPAPRPIEI